MYLHRKKRTWDGETVFLFGPAGTIGACMYVVSCGGEKFIELLRSLLGGVLWGGGGFIWVGGCSRMFDELSEWAGFGLGRCQRFLEHLGGGDLNERARFGAMVLLLQYLKLLDFFFFLSI